MEALFKRRSIRKYTDQKVKAEVIDYLLKAAMAAPSAKNRQPWEFVIIDDRTILDAIPRFHPNAQMLYGAPVAIVVCGNMDRTEGGESWIQDCSAATQNILLEITSLGLGGVWCGVYPKEEIVQALRELLRVPQNIVPFSIVSLGHPAEEKGPSDRFDSSRVHHNGW